MKYEASKAVVEKNSPLCRILITFYNPFSSTSRSSLHVSIQRLFVCPGLYSGYITFDRRMYCDTPKPFMMYTMSLKFQYYDETLVIVTLHSMGKCELPLCSGTAYSQRVWPYCAHVPWTFNYTLWSKNGAKNIIKIASPGKTNDLFSQQCALFSFFSSHCL